MSSSYFSIMYFGRSYSIRNEYRHLTRDQLEWAISMCNRGEFEFLSAALDYVSENS